MRIQQTRRSVALAGSVQVALALLTLLALLQLLLLHKRLKAYMRLRHSITMVNRLLRTLMALLPVAEQRYDIMSRWMQQSRPVPHPVAIVLAGYALFSPLLQLQVRLPALLSYWLDRMLNTAAPGAGLQLQWCCAWAGEGLQELQCDAEPQLYLQ